MTLAVKISLLLRERGQVLRYASPPLGSLRHLYCNIIIVSTRGEKLYKVLERN